MALDIDRAMFRTSYVRGYDMESVDNYLDDAKAHLAAVEISVRTGTRLGGPLPRAHFPVVIGREAYRRAEVDAFVDQVVAEIRRLLDLPRYVGVRARMQRHGH